MQLPKPSCPRGYTNEDLRRILQPESHYERFKKWMIGQTMGICDGRSYSHSQGKYVPSLCFQYPHGTIVYAQDLKRFLGGLPVID